MTEIYTPEELLVAAAAIIFIGICLHAILNLAEEVATRLFYSRWSYRQIMRGDDE